MPRTELHPIETLSGFTTQLTDAEQEWLQHCRRSVDPLRGEVNSWYRQNHAPTRDVVRQLGQAGMLGVHVHGPGCPGKSAVEYGLAAYALESVDSGLRSMLSVQGSLAMVAIATFGSDEQRTTWLPGLADGTSVGCFCLTEPNHGSDPASMETVATADGDGWVLRGTKRWVTNGPAADVAVVWARTGAGVNGFLVPLDRPGVQMTTMSGRMSLCASETGEVTFDDVRLDAGDLLPGARGLRAPLACLHEARFGIVFGALGAAYDCLVTTLEYLAQREQFGRPLNAFQISQTKVADMTIDFATAFAYAMQLGRAHDAGSVSPAQVSVGKANSTRVALDIARTCRTMLGANGILDEHPIMRHANNLESVLTYEGTTEMHQLVIGAELTGVTAFR